MSFRNSPLYFLSVNLLLAAGLIYGLTWMTFRWLAAYTQHDVYIKLPDLSSLDVNQAIAHLKKEGLQPYVDTTQYDPAFKPYEIFVYAPEKGDLVKPGRHIFIRANAAGFKPVSLPDVLHLNERMARDKLLESNIKAKVTYEPDATEGVLKILYNGVEIQAGTLIPYEAEVDLIVGRTYEKEVPVPDLTGMDLVSVKKILQEKRISLGEVIYDHPDKIEGAQVYRQEPQADKIYDEGKYLTIWMANVPKYQLDRLIEQHRLKKEPAALSDLSKGSAPSDQDVSLDEDIIIE